MPQDKLINDNTEAEFAVSRHEAGGNRAFRMALLAGQQVGSAKGEMLKVRGMVNKLERVNTGNGRLNELIEKHVKSYQTIARETQEMAVLSTNITSFAQQCKSGHVSHELQERYDVFAAKARSCSKKCKAIRDIYYRFQELADAAYKAWKQSDENRA